MLSSVSVQFLFTLSHESLQRFKTGYERKNIYFEYSTQKVNGSVVVRISYIKIEVFFHKYCRPYIGLNLLIFSLRYYKIFLTHKML